METKDLKGNKMFGSGTCQAARLGGLRPPNPALGPHEQYSERLWDQAETHFVEMCARYVKSNLCEHHTSMYGGARCEDFNGTSRAYCTHN